MMPHVGAQTLARFRQDDLGARRSSRIGAHLARCARCRALDEDLAGVTTLLASVHPPPMPEHLEARIQTALATEAARRVILPEENATAAATAGPAGTGSAVDGRHRRRERPGPGRRPARPRVRSAVALRAAAAAAAVVLLAGGVYELTHFGASSTSSAGSSAAGPEVPAPAAGQHAPAAGPSVFGPALPYQQAGGQGSIIPVMSGTDFTAENLGHQVTAQLDRYGRGAMTAGPEATTPGTTRGPAATGGRSATFGHMVVSDLAGCVNRIAAGDHVLLVDVARYQGAPATVIVTKPTGDSPEQIWVVGAGCSASRTDLLHQATLSPAG
jgi:hypothetical protein